MSTYPFERNRIFTTSPTNITLKCKKSTQTSPTARPSLFFHRYKADLLRRFAVGWSEPRASTWSRHYEARAPTKSLSSPSSLPLNFLTSIGYLAHSLPLPTAIGLFIRLFGLAVAKKTLARSRGVRQSFEDDRVPRQEVSKPRVDTVSRRATV